jgi:transcriptional regulator with GAF, ATPase, and Fis domain
VDPINDIINLDMKSFMEKQKQITFSSCVCMPLVNIKTLCGLLKDLKDYSSADKDEAEEIRRLSKRATMTIQISEDQQSFSNRSDII